VKWEQTLYHHKLQRCEPLWSNITGFHTQQWKYLRQWKHVKQEVYHFKTTPLTNLWRKTPTEINHKCSSFKTVLSSTTFPKVKASVRLKTSCYQKHHSLVSHLRFLSSTDNMQPWDQTTDLKLPISQMFSL